MKFHLTLDGKNAACGAVANRPDTFLYDAKGFESHYASEYRCRKCAEKFNEMKDEKKEKGGKAGAKKKSSAGEKIGSYLPVFSGFYNTIFQADEELAIEDPYTSDDYDFDYEEYEQEVAKECVKVVEEWLENFDIKIKFEELISPREYNFTNDSINVEYTIEKNTVKEILDYLEIEKEAFAKYIKKQYTSRDGFISSHSSDSEEWIKDLKDESSFHHKLGAILEFILEQEGHDEEELYSEISSSVYLNGTLKEAVVENQEYIKNYANEHYKDKSQDEIAEDVMKHFNDEGIDYSEKTVRKIIKETFEEVEDKSMKMFGKGGKTGKPKVKSIKKYALSSDKGKIIDYDKFVRLTEADEFAQKKSLSVKEVKEILNNLQPDEELDKLDDMDDIVDYLSDKSIIKKGNTYNQSFWGNAIEYGSMGIGESDGEQLIFLSMHIGGDVRGNYTKNKAYKYENIEDVPFYQWNLIVEIKTNKGDIRLQSEGDEAYHFIVEKDETGTWKEGDSMKHPDLEEKLDMDKKDIWMAKGGKIMSGLKSFFQSYANDGGLIFGGYFSASGNKMEKGGKIWKSLDFENIEQYYDYIDESYHNGNHSQVRDLVNKMNAEQKKEFFRYARDNNFYETIVWINEKMEKGGEVKVEVLKRTFEASKHPKDSAERAKLNEDSLTSEYMVSHKYEGRVHHPETKTHTAYTDKYHFNTKAEAEEYVASKKNKMEKGGVAKDGDRHAYYIKAWKKTIDNIKDKKADYENKESLNWDEAQKEQSKLEKKYDSVGIYRKKDNDEVSITLGKL